MVFFWSDELLFFLFIGYYQLSAWTHARTTSQQVHTNKSVAYAVVDGDIYVTYDDVLALSADRQSYTNVQYMQQESRHRRAVTAHIDKIWPNATIPYVIGHRINDAVRQIILRAMGHWEKQTCIKFINRDHWPKDGGNKNENDGANLPSDYIVFAPGECGCCSFVGRRGGAQLVTLSAHCAVYGVVVHELGHVVGFWHEHSRPDRDQYIAIVKENILGEKLDNFDKKSASEIDSLGQPYDYYSIMHYRKKTFTKNQKNTMVPLEKGVTIGQRVALSAGDIVQARLLYNCPKPKCYEEFSQSAGNFSTPNYPIRYFREHECTWVLHVLPGERLFVTFVDFELERSGNCTFDFVEIRQGIDESGQLFGRFCGSGVPGVIESSKSLWIWFRSDRSIAMRGFMAKYTKSRVVEDNSVLGSSGSGAIMEDMSVAMTGGLSTLGGPEVIYKAECNHFYEDRESHVQSPLMPIGFLNYGVDCSWTIHGGVNASRILLEIDYALIGGRNQCIGDVYQQILHWQRHDKHWNNKLQVDRYSKVRYNCQKSGDILLNTQSVMIQWSSDVNPAFNLSYVIDYDECTLGMSSCDHICKNTLRGYGCGCRRGYILHENGRMCSPKTVQLVDKCGGNLTSERGKIRSSTEPLRECYWYIYPPPHTRLILSFTRFSVPIHNNNSHNIIISSTNNTNSSSNNAAVVVNDSSEEMEEEEGEERGMKRSDCPVAYVEILTGKTMKSRGLYCGSEKPPPWSSPSSMMIVKLHTNLSSVHTMPYFSARYIVHKDVKNESMRCFHRLKAEGSISSPAYPSAYPANTACTWRVSARKGHRVRMEFLDLDLEATRMCYFDHVEVRNGRNRRSRLLGRFCGSKQPEPVLASGRHMWVFFLTDSSGSGKGFKAMFTSELPGDDKMNPTNFHRNVTSSLTQQHPNINSSVVQQHPNSTSDGEQDLKKKSTLTKKKKDEKEKKKSKKKKTGDVVKNKEENKIVKGISEKDTGIDANKSVNLNESSFEITSNSTVKCFNVTCGIKESGENITDEGSGLIETLDSIKTETGSVLYSQDSSVTIDKHVNKSDVYMSNERIFENERNETCKNLTSIDQNVQLKKVLSHNQTENSEDNNNETETEISSGSSSGDFSIVDKEYFTLDRDLQLFKKEEMLLKKDDEENLTIDDENRTSSGNKTAVFGEKDEDEITKFSGDKSSALKKRKKGKKVRLNRVSNSYKKSNKCQKKPCKNEEIKEKFDIFKRKFYTRLKMWRNRKKHRKIHSKKSQNSNKARDFGDKREKNTTSKSRSGKKKHDKSNRKKSKKT